MISPESFSNVATSQSLPDKSIVSTNNVELMPMDDVIGQDDIELLKSQLAAAHQLLSYQQDVVHSLTEQIHLKETHLLRAERQVDELQQQCQTQTVDIAEMRAICTDLRSQLKRQSRRQAQPSVQSVSSLPQSRPLGFEIQGQSRERASISFGYESASSETHVSAPLTKAPPVEAWSATHVQKVHEEVTFCQKLTTFIVSSTARVSSCAVQGEKTPTKPVPRQIARSKPKASMARAARPTAVELPHFAMG